MGEPHPIGDPSRPKLGELIVQRGLLTQEQLGEVLAEQQASGLPLGAILVRDGLVPSHTVAILLAEQSGGPLKTEFGYAVGAAPADGLRLAPPESPPEVEPVQALREVVAVVPEAAPAVPAIEPRVRELEAQLTAEVAARRALEQKLIDVEAGTEAALAGQAALDSRLAALERRTEELDALRASDQRSITGRPYTSERHLLLAPVEDRYELVEGPGPAPEAGSRIELFEDRSFLVVRVGPAPIPGALEACAYLEPIPTRFPPPNADTELT